MYHTKSVSGRHQAGVTDLIIPLLNRQGIGDGQPVTMHLEVSRLVGWKQQYFECRRNHSCLEQRGPLLFPR